MTPAQAATLRREKIERMASEFQTRAASRENSLAQSSTEIFRIATEAERDVYVKCAEVTRLLAAGVLTP